MKGKCQGSVQWSTVALERIAQDSNLWPHDPKLLDKYFYSAIL